MRKNRIITKKSDSFCVTDIERDRRKE